MNAKLQRKFQLPQRKKQIQVEVSIRFGNPKYQDCRNFGICKMEVFDQSNLKMYQKKQFAHAIMIKEKEDSWIYFLKESMNPATLKMNFGKGFFLIEREKKVSVRIAEELEIEELTILPQRYEYMETEKFLIIKLTTFQTIKER